MADQIRPTPRSPILGLFSDLVNLPLQYMSDVNRTQQMRGMAEFIRSTGVPSTLERLSYGQGLFTGAGGLGGTTRLRPEVAEAALTVAPMVGPAARVAGRGAMAVGRAGERYAERVVPQIMERGGLPAEMVAAMGQGTQSPLTVYHGSPYRFNRFDPTKIGSGEGAQAFGYGHYTAEARPVAEEYMRLLGRPDTSMLSPAAKRAFDRAAKDIIDKTGDPKLVSPRYTANFAASKAKGSVADELMKYAENPPPRTGNLYTIDIPDEQIARMLDWDKPLSQQPKEIRDAINKTKSMLPANAMEDLGGDLSLLYGKDVTPNQFLNTWEAIAGRPGAGEEALRQAGIPGIRYLDQGSRRTGTGTSNFVVFPGNEDLLRILEVNGEELLNPIMYRDPFGSTVR